MKNKKQWCSSCKKETNQKIDYETTIFEPVEVFRRGSDKSAWTIACKKIFVSACLGCDVKNLNIINEHLGPNGPIAMKKQDKRVIVPKNWVFELENENIFQLFMEIYSAVNNSLYRLAILGIRSIVDFYLNDRVGDIGGFQQKLKDAKKKNILSDQQYDTLHSVIEIGHSVVHRQNKITKSNILEIINVIESIFIQDIHSGKMKKIESRLPEK